MATLDSDFSFTGSLGGLSAYRIKGSNKTYIRKKGGASKKTIKTSPKFANTRRLNSEFGGRSTTSQMIRFAIEPHRHVADFPFTGALNALLKPIQELDSGEWGKRNVFVSRNRKLLEGFSLNRQTVFENYVQAPLSISLSRNEASATVVIPDLHNSLNFFSMEHPYYQFVVSLGMVPDMAYGRRYAPVVEPVRARSASTEWYARDEEFPETTLTLSLQAAVPDAMTLVLAVGIHFGVPSAVGNIKPIRSGAARIMAVI